MEEEEEDKEVCVGVDEWMNDLDTREMNGWKNWMNHVNGGLCMHITKRRGSRRNASKQSKKC